MDPYNTRPRGRARLPQRPQFEQTRAPRLPNQFSRESRQQLSRPQIPQPQMAGPQMPRPQISRPNRDRSEIGQTVEEIVPQIESMSRDIPTQYGRGTVRGRRQLDIEYYRAPRPETSLTSIGKQGTSGDRVKLTTNYFPITSYTNWQLYQYRVNFSPEEDRISIQRGLLHLHKQTLGSYIFDGTMIFSNQKYQSDKFELTSKREIDDQIVTITIFFTSALQPNDYAYIQVFNLILRNCLRHLNLQLVGRNYYDPQAEINIPKYKLKLWPGYETTIGMFDSGLMLRAEISTKVMREETVLDYLQQCINNRHQGSDYMMNFKAVVIGSIVLTKYNNKTYKIDDIDEISNTNSTFTKKDGSKITYVQYYKERWNLQIDCEQPMLISKKKKVFNTTSDIEDLIYLVPQFCTLTGMTDAMRSNFNLMSDLSVYTRVSPSQRIDKLNRFIGRLNSTEKSMEAFNRWNLTLSNSLVEIPGRILSQETITSQKNDFISGSNADWTRHLRSFPLYACAEMKRWVVVTPAFCFNDVKAFLSTLSTVSRGLCFNIPQPEISQINDGSMGSYLSKLEEVINYANPSFILCVVATNRADIYNSIKRKLCIDRAVPSQVVVLKNVKKNNMSVCTKIAIQINCKLGGAPWFVKIPVKGLMIVGFDVCHDSRNKNVSYGAFIATMNDDHTSYFSCVQPHRSGEEISNYFSINMSKALNKYRHKNGMLPQKIIVYRDGVGDGQLSQVHKNEINIIKGTLYQFYNGKEELAFIIVKKRINTRFFMNNREIVNPPPGTVIDSVVTDPSMYDFYLISQCVRQGTVTPTHYNIISDNLKNWSPDKMQKLTYKLCHMYYNWSGTVRVPSLCQLAHKLAFLHAQSLKSPTNPALDELLYYL